MGPETDHNGQSEPAVTRAVTWLSALVLTGAAIAAGVGAFVGGGSGRFDVMSIHGQAVQLYGRGLYAHDTVLVGVGNRGTDVAVLLFEIPLLLFAVVSWPPS